MLDKTSIKAYAEASTDEYYILLEALCRIPAPSGYEDKRADFCFNWLKSVGYDNVYIDDAKNVVCPINCEDNNDITVIVAHTDTVFPDTEPMPYYEKDGKLYSPGIGDDTACLVTLLLTAKYLKQIDFKPEEGLLFVCNSCEEGLGNLKGTREIMKVYGSRVNQFISIDSNFSEVVNNCVGSHRYEVEVKADGGHSFLAFGNKSAISILSKMINEIYSIDIPISEGHKTTYNVGTINGGTSINTIAQSAKMLCEYRSDDNLSLEYMRNKFEKVFDSYRCDDVEVTVTLVGDRPCAKGIDTSVINKMVNVCKDIIEEITGIPIRFGLSSTDCNIPLSMGIPAVCIGAYEGGGIHTREEWVQKDTLPLGIEVLLNTIDKLVK